MFSRPRTVKKAMRELLTKLRITKHTCMHGLQSCRLRDFSCFNIFYGQEGMAEVIFLNIGEASNTIWPTFYELYLNVKALAGQQCRI